MKYVGPLIAVKDMQKAKRFYHDVLGLDVVADFGANVTLSGGLSLQAIDTWKAFIDKNDAQIVLQNNAGELYFEEDNIDRFMARLSQIKDINYVHPLKEHAWGQRVVRFYDLDGHMIEVGENIVMVVKRFADRGLSPGEIAVVMDVPIDFVQSCLA